MKLKFSVQVLILTTFVSILGCSITQNQHKGHIVPGFSHKCNFTTIKTVIVLPVEINGATRNFLFDTGADFTLIQTDTIKGNTKKVSGATNRNMKLGHDIIKSFKIGDVEFDGTYAMYGDFKGLKEQVPNFGGLIGQPIISKANWLINYPDKNIEISNKHLIDSTYTVLKIIKEHETPYVTLTLDGVAYKALIDLGSSSAFSIPENSKLAKKIQEKYNFRKNEREIYTIGGLQNTQGKVGTIATIYLDGIEFKNVETTIRNTSQIRIGNDFFKDYVVYIDNIHSQYSIKRIN